MEKYLKKLTRYQASTIFKARSRMLAIKDNFKTQYRNNMTCRACGLSDETQTHVLEECLEIHRDDTTKVSTNEIFNNDILKHTAMYIARIMEVIEKA